MARKQKDWARKTRDSIFDVLGRKCVKCSKTKKLEFDVIIPIGDDSHHRKYDWSHRMSFYRKQLAQNNLQVLCKSCNSSKGNR